MRNIPPEQISIDMQLVKIKGLGDCFLASDRLSSVFSYYRFSF